MPEMAKHIDVRRTHEGYCLRVDGKDFPWYCSEEGVRTSVPRDGSPSVTLTLLAERVSVEHELTASRPSARDHYDPTGRLARAEAARDGAEELLDNAQKAQARHRVR